MEWYWVVTITVAVQQVVGFALLATHEGRKWGNGDTEYIAIILCCGLIAYPISLLYRLCHKLGKHLLGVYQRKK